MGLAPGRIASGSWPPLSAPRVNAHVMRDGRYLGHRNGSDRAGTALPANEVCVFTGFDPSRVVHVIVAGDADLHLFGAAGPLPAAAGPAVARLTSHLRALEAGFSLLVLEAREDGVRLVHATAFPGWRQYEPRAADVHEAVLCRLRA
jgi:hypothetical protein